jgi:hypothetical protein
MLVYSFVSEALLGEERSLVFEKYVVQRTFGPEEKEVTTRGWKKE